MRFVIAIVVLTGCAQGPEEGTYDFAVDTERCTSYCDWYVPCNEQDTGGTSSEDCRLECRIHFQDVHDLSSETCLQRERALYDCVGNELMVCDSWGPCQDEFNLVCQR